MAQDFTVNLTDIAVYMWRRAPRMIQQPPTLSQDEMRQLLSHVWMRQFVYPDGNPVRDKQVFTQKHCADCHASGTHGAPPLRRENTRK